MQAQPLRPREARAHGQKTYGPFKHWKAKTDPAYDYWILAPVTILALDRKAYDALPPAQKGYCTRLRNGHAVIPEGCEEEFAHCVDHLNAILAE